MLRSDVADVLGAAEDVTSFSHIPCMVTQQNMSCHSDLPVPTPLHALSVLRLNVADVLDAAEDVT